MGIPKEYAFRNAWTEFIYLKIYNSFLLAKRLLSYFVVANSSTDLLAPIECWF